MMIGIISLQAVNPEPNWVVWLERVSLLSMILVPIIAAMGLRQLGLFKADLRFRAERAAKEKAIEFASRYLDRYVEKSNDWSLLKLENEIPDYRGPVGDFSYESVPKELLKDAVARAVSFQPVMLLNELETISAAFVSGVADERTGFSIIGRSFCASVGHNYDVIALTRRKQGQQYWHNIVTLYQTWAPRLSKAELEAATQALSQQLAGIAEREIRHIGQDS